jgi:hypothetical protein
MNNKLLAEELKQARVDLKIINEKMQEKELEIRAKEEPFVDSSSEDEDTY